MKGESMNLKNFTTSDNTGERTIGTLGEQLLSKGMDLRAIQTDPAITNFGDIVADTIRIINEHPKGKGVQKDENQNDAEISTKNEEVLNEVELDRPNRGIYNHWRINRKMQREMDEFFKPTKNETITQKPMNAEQPKESVSPLKTQLEAAEAREKNWGNTEEQQTASNLLQSPYDAAMDRIWKENEAKRSAQSLSLYKETPVLKTTEQSSTVLEGEFREIKRGQTTPALSHEEILAITEQNARKREQILKQIELADSAVTVRAEKAGGWMVEKARSVGKWWNKLPRHYKYTATAGLVVTGAGAALVGSIMAGGTVASLAAGYRALAGAGLFATFEEAARRAHEKKTGEPITEAVAARHTILAGTLAVLMTAMLPTAMHNVLEGTGIMVPTATPEKHVSSGKIEVLANADLVRQGSFIETAQAGDSVWKMTANQLRAHYGEKFTDLSTEKQTIIINAIKNKIAEHPESYGMASGDVEKLAIGEHIDFGQILNDKEFIDAQFSHETPVVSEKITVSETPTEEAVTSEAPQPDKRSEWWKQFAEQMKGKWTPEQGGEFGQRLNSALLANNPEEIFKIEKEMGVTHEELVKLFQEANSASDTPIMSTDALQHFSEMTPPAAEEIPQEKVMPQEIAPKNPQVLAFADQQIHDDINSLFGKKGFLGFGYQAGTESADWLNLKGKSVAEVMETNTDGLTENGTGIQSKGATSKMQEYLANAFKQSNVQPIRGETIEDYLKRAAAINLGKIMNKG